MMRLQRLGFIVIFSALAAIGSDALASFEPLFRVVQVTGECSLQRPAESKSSPAEESKAYPYGTTIQTGLSSSLIVVLSDGNLCRVLANSNLVMDEGTPDKKLKIIRLNKGEVEVELEEDFNAEGNSLNVETATATCVASGSKFCVASKQAADLRIIDVRVIAGQIRVHGDNFNAASLGKDDRISLRSPADLGLLLIKTMKGEFDINIKDEDLQDMIVSAEEGTILKIWQSKVPHTDRHVVVVQVIGPDGKIIETVTAEYD